MANKPLKSIKFPDLPDTYTVPVVDNTLAVTGAAADAKETGDKITGLKEDLNSVEDILKATKKHLSNVYIATNGVISAGSTYDTVYFQVIAESLIDISNTDTVFTYAFYVSEPTIGSASYNNNRSYVNSESISNVAVPTGCTWIAIRTNHLGDVSISPESLLDVLEETSFKIPKTTDAITVPANTDLNNLTANGLHYLNGLVYDNSPFESGQYAFLLNYCSAVLRLQICIGYNSTRTKIYVRDYGASNWNSWKEYDSASTILEKAIVSESTALAETDLNNVFGNHVWLMTDSYTYTNKPSALTSNTGFLVVADVFNGWTLQLLYSFTGGACWKRRGKHAATPTWEQWEKIGGGGIENNYTFNEYINTYEVTATPSITTDVNNYLASTGDTTDVTTSIVSMLEASKVCRLGAGVFYVSDLVMPNDTEIIGSGASTQIILAGSSDGFAVKMGSRCIISDLMISGSTSDIALSDTVGNRHGILWQGNYTADKNSNHQPQMSIINNVYINHFTGGAITCYDTGFGTYNHLEVTNAFIYNCNAGINISYWSEFHKFTNVRTYLCYYGCVNNGGNNTFVNCDFSKCTLAFLMDNSQNQSPNNSHGSAIGCVFNHTDNNTGIGIKILNCDNGFVFSGCQIFFSQIYIKDSDGVTISNSNFGRSNCDIIIDGGGVVLFIGNLYGSVPTITIANNNNVHFVNCYVSDTGSVVGQ